jgi:hypothetical protein|uniref:Uncharacterized protein n=1 Tax=viral metagenome TaxID=1070528 RepID=A0A6C0JC73_9ZZZZ
MTEPRGVITKMNKDGTPNAKYVDVLDEDKSIAGQKFVCISFISPDKIIEDKNRFFFKEFLKNWELNKSMEKYMQFLHFVSEKYSVDFNSMTKDLEDFCKIEKNNLFSTTLADEYKTFIDNNEDRLTSEYDESNMFQTSTRGVKIRGSYPNQGEAELRAKLLRELDPNHDVFVGPVGMWMPFHPEAYKTGRVEYLEDELNQLMHEKNKNEKKAKQEFEQRVKSAKKKAIEDNKEKALKSGNVLTQTIDEQGNLVSVKDISTMDRKLGDDVSVADIRKELFEDENVVIDKNTDHGLSDILNKKD